MTSTGARLKGVKGQDEVGRGWGMGRKLVRLGDGPGHVNVKGERRSGGTWMGSLVVQKTSL